MLNVLALLGGILEGLAEAAPIWNQFGGTGRSNQ